MSVGVAFEDVRAGYGDKEVLHGLSLAVPAGTFLTVIGRSGCGKTTLLKLVNGLLAPTSGRVLVAGRDVAQCDPIALRRSIGYAIQGVGLFPHMTVAGNIAYVPSLSGLWSREEERREVARLLELVGLDPALARRHPRELSGGQCQRVGIARALAAKPPLLLMDEPFGAVDEITRVQLQAQLQALYREMGVTVIFVTHDIAEALRLGTQVLVLEDGRAVQLDAPRRLKEHPADPFVSQLLAGQGQN